MDPLTWDYPELTNYQYASNEPIANVDMDGLEASLSLINEGTWFNLPQLLDPVVISVKLPTAAVKEGVKLGIANGLKSFANIGLQQLSQGVDNTYLRPSPQTVERVGDNTLQSVGHREIMVPGQQVMDPISWSEKLSGQRSIVTDDGFGNKIRLVVDNEGLLTNQMAFTNFEVPFVPDRAPFSVVKFFRGVFKSGSASKTISINRLSHIFGKSEHALESLVTKFGSQEGAYSAVQIAANQAFKEGKLTPNAKGILPSGDLGNIINVDGMDVRLIGGRVKNGKIILSSFSRKGL